MKSTERLCKTQYRMLDAVNVRSTAVEANLQALLTISVTVTRMCNELVPVTGGVPTHEAVIGQRLPQPLLAQCGVAYA